MDLAKLTSLSSIYYEETNLDFLRPLPQMFSCGVQMICTQGEALVSTGAQHFSLKPMSELIFLERKYYASSGFIGRFSSPFATLSSIVIFESRCFVGYDLF